MAISSLAKRKILGVLLLLAVVVIWVASSTAIQALFNSSNYFKPYFLTYFSTGMFTFYLAKLLIKRENYSTEILKKTLKVSLQFCIFWFGANYFFNLSLGLTTVSSNTILSSTSGIITLILSVCILKESPDVLKFIAVLIAFSGVLLISISDEGDGEEGALGDIFAFVGAIFYGFYSVLLKKKAN